MRQLTKTTSSDIVLCSIDAFVRDPIGRTCASEQLLCWRADESLRCIAVWERVDDKDIAFLTRAMATELTHARYSSLVDIRAMSGASVDAYENFLTFMGAHKDTLRTKVVASAIVHSGGPEAALVAGYSRLLESPFPVSLHATVGSALEALNKHATVADELVARVEFARSRTDVLTRARRHLRANLASATLSETAAALSTSERSLQRALSQHDTSFRRELECARTDRALTLLSETEDKVLSIALSVGYAQEHSLSTAVKKRTGLTPASWRARRRTAPH